MNISSEMLFALSGFVLNLAGIVGIALRLENRLTRIEERFDGHVKICDRDTKNLFVRMEKMEER